MTERQRTTELCVLGSEADAMAMEMELRENGIVPVVVRTASEAFPGVIGRSRWGTLRVAEDELERAREVLEAWYARDDDEIDEDELARQALEAGGRSEEERHREVASMGPPYRAPGRPTHTEVSGPTARSAPVSTLIAGASIALNVGLGAWIVADRAGQTSGDVAAYADRDERIAPELFDEDGDGRWDELRVRGQGLEGFSLRDDDGDGLFESVICDGEPRAIRCP